MTVRLFNKYPFFIIAGLLIIASVINHLGITINFTPSMKEGIYIKKAGQIERGDIVAACLDEPYQAIGLKNSYLIRSTKCHGAAPVIKKIIAVPGDNVLLTYDYIRVNGRKLLFKTKLRDRSGNSLHVYPRGHYLQTDGYWLIGINSRNSWDSRYWGYVKKEQILYRLTYI